MLDCFHPLGNRLPVGLRNIPVRPEIEHVLLPDFRGHALILSQSIGVAGFSINTIGNLVAPEKTWLTSLEIGSGGAYIDSVRSQYFFTISGTTNRKVSQHIVFLYHPSQHVVFSMRNRRGISDKMPKIMMMHPIKVPTRVKEHGY